MEKIFKSQCELDPTKPNVKLFRAIFIYYCQDQGYFTLLIDPTQVESKKSSQIQWPVPSINAEPVDIFLGEE